METNKVYVIGGLVDRTISRVRKTINIAMMRRSSSLLLALQCILLLDTRAEASTGCLPVEPVSYIVFPGGQTAAVRRQTECFAGLHACAFFFWSSRT